MARHDERGLELGQRGERECPLVEARVGNRQARLVDRDAVEQQEIEVDDPWPVPRPLARPAQLALDVEQGCQQSIRRERWCRSRQRRSGTEAGRDSPPDPSPGTTRRRRSRFPAVPPGAPTRARAWHGGRRGSIRAPRRRAPQPNLKQLVRPANGAARRTQGCGSPSSSRSRPSAPSAPSPRAPRPGRRSARRSSSCVPPRVAVRPRS